MTRKNVALVHVPHAPISPDVWLARRAMLTILGWRSGTIGLCPLPTQNREDSSVSLGKCEPTLQALTHLGCVQAYGVRELSFAPGSLFADMDALSSPGMTLREWGRSVSALPGGYSILRHHVEAVIAKINAKAELVAEGDMLFVASPHPWLLLVLVSQLIASEHGADQERVLAFDASAFPGIGIVNADGYWRGFLDLSPQHTIEWYLERLP